MTQIGSRFGKNWTRFNSLKWTPLILSLRPCRTLSSSPSTYTRVYICLCLSSSIFISFSISSYFSLSVRLSPLSTLCFLFRFSVPSSFSIPLFLRLALACSLCLYISLFASILRLCLSLSVSLKAVCILPCSIFPFPRLYVCDLYFDPPLSFSLSLKNTVWLRWGFYNEEHTLIRELAVGPGMPYKYRLTTILFFHWQLKANGKANGCVAL